MPLLGIGACVSIQFGALAAMKRFFQRQNAASGSGGPGGKQLSFFQLTSAGAIAGVANGVVSGPVEHIRIRASKLLDSSCFPTNSPNLYFGYMTGLQTQSDKNRLYNGPFDAMKKISSTYGISGLFKGQAVTFTREAVGCGAYFWAYEALVQKWVQETRRKRGELPAPYAIAYGAAAGYAVSIVLLLYR